MHNTSDFSSGSRYNPTTSISFSSNLGSVDNLNVFTRCGFNPRAAQIRCTVAGDTPTFFAIVRTDQCVSPSGLEFLVKSTISSIFSFDSTGLRPRPAAAFPNLATPSGTNRDRHDRTVDTLTPTCSAIRAVAAPSPAANNTRARNTCRCGAVCDPANWVRISRSPSDKGNGAAGACIHQSYARSN